MSSALTTDPATATLVAAVDVIDGAVEQLIKLAVDDGGVLDLGTFGLVEVLQRMEAVRNKLPAVDRALIQRGSEQGVPATLSERTMTRVLMNGMRLSAGEASRRVKAAEHLADRTSMVGEPLGPPRTHLAAAQRTGLVTPEQVSLIDGALRKVRHCDVAAVEAGGPACRAGHPARLSGSRPRRRQAHRSHRPRRDPAQ